MALVDNYLTAIINQTFMPTLIDLIFTKDHYLAKVLKEKAETFNGRLNHLSVEMGESANIQETSRMDPLSLALTDEFAGISYGNRMLNGTITIPLEDELENMNKSSIKKMVVVKMKNLQKSLEKKFAEILWERNAGGPDGSALNRPTKQWNTIDYLVNNGTANVGNIDDGNAGDVPDYWKSEMLKNTAFTGDITVEADLLDPTKDTYLPRLFAYIIAKSEFRAGDKSIFVPQYIWDLYEFILDEKKTANKYNDRLGSLGFEALNFRGGKYPVIAENDMKRAQTSGSDVDGRIYCINLDYLYMQFNSRAKFKLGKFQQLQNQNGKRAIINVFGNTIITNRNAQVAVKGVRSPEAYGQ